MFQDFMHMQYHYEHVFLLFCFLVCSSGSTPYSFSMYLICDGSFSIVLSIAESRCAFEQFQFTRRLCRTGIFTIVKNSAIYYVFFKIQQNCPQTDGFTSIFSKTFLCQTMRGCCAHFFVLGLQQPHSLKCHTQLNSVDFL